MSKTGGLVLTGISTPPAFFLGIASFVCEPWKTISLVIGTLLFVVFVVLFVSIAVDRWERLSRFVRWFFLPLRYFLPISIAPIPRFHVPDEPPDCHFKKIKVCYRDLGHWVKKNRKSALIMSPPIPPTNPHDRCFHLLQGLQFSQWQEFTTRHSKSDAKDLFEENGEARDQVLNCGGVLGKARYLFITWYLNPTDVERHLRGKEIDLKVEPIAEMRYFLTMLRLRTEGNLKDNQGKIAPLFVNRYVIINENRLSDISHPQYLDYVKSVAHYFLIENCNYRITFVSEECLDQVEDIALFKDMALFSNDPLVIAEAENNKDAQYPLPVKADYYNLLQYSSIEDNFLYLYYTLNKKDIKRAVQVATQFIEKIQRDVPAVDSRIRSLLGRGNHIQEDKL